MDIERTNQWLTFIANVGVLAGIIFLAIELRHSSNAISAQTQDSIADGFIQLSLATVSDPTVGENWVIGLHEPERLTNAGKIRFSMHMRALFNQYRRVHGLYRNGLLDESDWALYAREASTIMSSAGGKLHWAGNEMDAKFQSDLERYAGDESNVHFLLESSGEASK